MKWKILIRDVVIIWGLTYLGGFVAGFGALPDDSQLPLRIMAATFVFATLGFAIVAWFTQHKRFLHLVRVAFGVWILSLINLWFGIPIIAWLLGIIPLFCFMLLGWGITIVLERLTGRKRDSPARNY